MIIKNINNFDIHQIADSGQTFRWYPYGKGYIIVANHEVVEIYQDGNEITILGCENTIEVWEKYFDWNRDYAAITASYLGKDQYLDSALNFGLGIRILKQDIFEMLVTFMISANNNIKRITSAVGLLSERYGTYLKTVGGTDYYDFPTAKQLQGVDLNELRDCGVGYRDKYLYQLFDAINSARFDLDQLNILNHEEQKRELLQIKGIGEKVANCVMLFAFGQVDAFPVDTWIKKVIVNQYHIDQAQVQKFVDEYFQPYGGIAQQYLFYYGRYH